MIKVKEIIILEGKYDRNKLSNIVEGDFIETSGFGIYNNPKLRSYILSVAEKRGILILTDPDGAGFQIRNYIKSFVPAEYVRHAYVPSIKGKERRKAHPSAEGTLGVEGVSEELIINAIRSSGASVYEQGQTIENIPNAYMNPFLFYKLGFSGQRDSAKKRKMLTDRLGIPDKISTSELISFLNIAVDEARFYSIATECAANEEQCNN